MAQSASGHEDFILEESDRSAGLTIDRVSTILEKVIERLSTAIPSNATCSAEQEKSSHISTSFSLKSLPAIKMRDYVQRYYQYGQLSPNLLIAGLILFDRALQTRLIPSSLSVHK